MMIHRKTTHYKVVKQCEKFNKNICHFKSDSCWYLHREESTNINTAENVENSENQSVFQKAHWNLKPPLNNIKKKQKME